jgi:hypothetical protein
MRLVIEATIIIIVPIITSFQHNALSLLAPVVDPTACISATDEVVQVSVILITPSAALLRWSETTS